MVKKDVEDFCEFHFSLLFYSSFSFRWHLSRVVKSEVTELFQLPCSCGRTLVFIIGCENKPICYKDVLVNSFYSPTFILENSLVAEPFFDLLSKWLVNLELIPSSQRKNQNLVYSLWSPVDIKLQCLSSVEPKDVNGTSKKN